MFSDFFLDNSSLLNSSHASSRDRKHASERDFRGRGLATKRLSFLSSFPFVKLLLNYV